MSFTTLVALSPRLPATGAVTNIQLVHNARVSGRFFGEQWLPQYIESLPDFEMDLGFDGQKFGTGATPQVGQLVLNVPKDSSWPSLAWMGALVSIRSAPWPGHFADPADAAFSAATLYRVENVACSADGRLTLTLIDMGQALRQPVQVRKFGSTADPLLDGAGVIDLKGKIVPTGWGKLLGVPGLLLDRINNIYLLLDRPTSVIHAIYDGGATFTAGVVRASLAALQANVPASGTVDVCGNAGGLTLVRPWTAPTYPLTADITASGPTTAADIAAAIVTARSALTFVPGTVAAFNALQGADCQIHINDERSIATALDELICRLGGHWKITPGGRVELGRMDFTAPAVTFGAHQLMSIERKRIVMPTRRRAVSYAKNNRVHTEAEIATILLAGDIEGLGDLAYLNNVDWALVTGAGRPDTGATRNAAGQALADTSFDPARWLNVGTAGFTRRAGAYYGANAWPASHGLEIDIGAATAYKELRPVREGGGHYFVSVVPGQRLHMSFYAWAESLSSPDIVGLIVFFGVDGITHVGYSPGVTPAVGSGAQLYRTSGVAPSNAAYALFLIYKGDSSGHTGRLHIGAPYLGFAAAGADITGENTALNTANVGGQTAAALVADAATAKAGAASALSSISIIVSDGYLSRGEKPALIKEWLAIDAEVPVLTARASALGLSGHAARVAYSAAYDAAASYLTSLSPGWSNTALDTPIVAATFRGKFTDYYYARQALLDLFTATVKARADAGVTDAAAAQASASSALSSISIIVADGYLDRSEKPRVVQDWMAIVNENASIAARAAALGLAAHATYTAYSGALTALSTYLGGLSPAYDNTALDTAIVGATFRGKFTDYYYARQLLLDLFTATVKAVADDKTRNVDRGPWVALAMGAPLVVGDEVQDQGSTWGCILAHTKSAGNGPPTLPTSANSTWRLRSAKGDNGQTGEGTTKIFIRSVAKPSTPAASAGVPSGYYTDPDAIPAGAGFIWAHTGSRAAGASLYTWAGAVRDEAVSIVSGEKTVTISGLGATAWILVALEPGQTLFAKAQWRANWSGSATANLGLEIQELNSGSPVGLGSSDGPQGGNVGEPTLLTAEGNYTNPSGAGRQYQVRAVASKTGAGTPSTVLPDSYVKA